jgi:hypothetical protein
MNAVGNLSTLGRDGPGAPDPDEGNWTSCQAVFSSVASERKAKLGLQPCSVLNGMSHPLLRRNGARGDRLSTSTQTRTVVSPIELSRLNRAKLGKYHDGIHV